MTRHSFEYDLVTIGAGSAGVRASRFAAKHYAAKVAIVDLPYGAIASQHNGGAGGTCVLRGCVPKKLLMHGSSVGELLEDAQGFGWEGIQGTPNWEALMMRKAKEVERVKGIYADVLNNNGIELVEGWASFQDGHTVSILNADGDIVRTLTAANVLLATGGLPRKIDIPGADLAITSDEALSLPHLPARIAIIGGGRVAAEMTGIFSGMGSEVHLVYRKNLPLAELDMDLRKVMRTNLNARATLHPTCNVAAIEKNADGTLQLTMESAEGTVEAITVDQVLMAVGRAPRTTNMHLDKARVDLNDDGTIKVNSELRTSAPHVWAVGDVVGRREQTPVALMEGMAVAHFCFGGKDANPPALDYKNIPAAIFSQPPVATVGMSEEAAIASFSGRFDIFISKFKPMRSTLSGRDERTLIKLVVDTETDTVLGAHMVGPDAPEIMQGIAIAMKAGAKKEHFDATVGIHPTAAEEFVGMRSPARTMVGEGAVPYGTPVPPVELNPA